MNGLWAFANPYWVGSFDWVPVFISGRTALFYGVVRG